MISTVLFIYLCIFILFFRWTGSEAENRVVKLCRFVVSRRVEDYYTKFSPDRWEVDQKGIRCYHFEQRQSIFKICKVVIYKLVIILPTELAEKYSESFPRSIYDSKGW